MNSNKLSTRLTKSKNKIKLKKVILTSNMETQTELETRKSEIVPEQVNFPILINASKIVKSQDVRRTLTKSVDFEPLYHPSFDAYSPMQIGKIEREKFKMMKRLASCFDVTKKKNNVVEDYKTYKLVSTLFKNPQEIPFKYRPLIKNTNYVFFRKIGERPKRQKVKSMFW